MGWLILVTLVVVASAGLWLRGTRGAMLQACVAALLFGAAGYAAQGRPSLPSAPARQQETAAVVPLTGARHAFYGNFSSEESWMRFSEGLARAGKSEEAVGLLSNAVRRYPGSGHLWVGLGNALVEHSHGVTPPAEFAYRRAAELSPGQPGPPYFYGLALARTGDRAAAVLLWREILATAPADASWRPLVEGSLEAVGAGPGPKPR